MIVWLFPLRTLGVVVALINNHLLLSPFPVVALQYFNKEIVAQFAGEGGGDLQQNELGFFLYTIMVQVANCLQRKKDLKQKRNAHQGEKDILLLIASTFFAFK